MSDDDKHEVFMAARLRVSEKAWKDYVWWRDTVGAMLSRSSSAWYRGRFNWCMGHPEWSEAVMLALLEGKW